MQDRESEVRMEKDRFGAGLRVEASRKKVCSFHQLRRLGLEKVENRTGNGANVPKGIKMGEWQRSMGC